MQKINLGPQGDGPYEHQVNFAIGDGSQAIQTNFYAQVFAGNGKAVLMMSEMPENYTEPKMRPLEYDTTGATYAMMKQLGVNNFLNLEVIYHKPENVTGDNPETFERVNHYFDLNGLREHYRNPREELSADQVAEKIGPENFHAKQFAQEATVKEEVAAQPDYGRANLASQSVADNETSAKSMRDVAHDYDPEH